MINYTPQNQLTLDGFILPFSGKLVRSNRWVRLAEALPWDKLAKIYYKDMEATIGRPSLSARLVIAAVLVKHTLNLSDEETIETIKENPYLQFLCGFSEFTTESAFDSSLFVKIRERLGQEKFESFTSVLIKTAEIREEQTKKKPKAGKGKAAKKDTRSKNDASGESQSSGERKEQPEDESSSSASMQREPLDSAEIEKETETLPDSEPVTHRGRLLVDATVADQYIKYPTDLGLLNECRQKCEMIIDRLYEKSGLKQKPRTYRRCASKEFLNISKKKNKTGKEIRKAIGKQLRYVHRDIGIIHRLMDLYAEGRIPLDRRTMKLFWVIQEIYRQQEEMYRTKTHRCQDRIVNLYQPHVRPIVRGKEGRKVEFGAKIGVGLLDGYAQVETISWNAYDEGSDLVGQVEEYKRVHGYYPEVVLADQKYWNRENRRKLKELGIRCSGKSLGRPKSEGALTKAERKRNRKEHGMRNAIEGKFGQGKNGYGLNKIRAKKPDTSESWIMSIFFVMNILRFIEQVATNFFMLIFQCVRKRFLSLQRPVLLLPYQMHHFHAALLFQ
jgi:transposase, IS5 family